MDEAPLPGRSWERVKQIFHEVREATGPERERRLAVLCGEDAELTARVRALLEAEADGGDFLGSPTVEEADAAAREAAARATAELAESGPPEGPGAHIGPYKLLQRIGEGGFGVVYMAEQERPVRRRVALKVIKPGMDTKQVIARFESERQALAMLDHPNIAKVFDAGSTPAGRPYFVMELVRGIPITGYCDEQRLGTRERLELFASVCAAVNHANENGIVHRDIKPSNILVTLHDGTPVPKVIDFGVAKAIRQRLTESTLFTEYNQFIGTPEYMAPEQAAYAGLDVDRRSDVYSLGALLYELLTGTTPFESHTLRRAAQLEILRILREEDPPRPSTRISTMGDSSEELARYRRTDASGLAKLLRGDLDWIVMKALEKDRTRRYDSAADLAADIGRYFEQRPIVARPPSAAYRLGKLMRRRRGPLAAAVVVALGLLADVVYVSWQNQRNVAEVTMRGNRPGGLLLTSDDWPCYEPGDVRPSPDGTKLLGVDLCFGGALLHNTRTGETEMITEREWYSRAVWSPDGARIAVGRTASEEAFLLDLATKEQSVPASLAGLPFLPVRWSPDRDHLVGQSWRKGGNNSLVLVSLTGGESSVLVERSGYGRDDGAFSPDGRYFVFPDLVGESQNLFVYEVATGQRWALTTGPENDRTALWAPDGKTVVYGNESGMWALPVSEGRKAGEPSLVLHERVLPSDWTQHGYYYGFYNTAARMHLIGVDPQTGSPTGHAESSSLPPALPSDGQLAWAPDMQRIASAAMDDDRIYIVRGGVVTSFPVGPEIMPMSLWWSKDGRDVLFTSRPQAQQNRSRRTVFALDPEEGDIREMFPPVAGASLLHVSPDGGRMVWLRQNPSRSSLEPAVTPSDPRYTDLVISDLGSTSGQVLASSTAHRHLAGLIGQPLFSPDGSHVQFLRIDPTPQTSSLSLCVVGSDGSPERQLDSQPYIGPGVWDPTGRMIAYQFANAETASGLRVVSVADGRTHEIEAFSQLDNATLRAWSPDGAWLAVTESVGQWEFWASRDILGSRD